MKVSGRTASAGRGGTGCGWSGGVSVAGRGTEGRSASTAQAARVGFTCASTTCHAASSRAVSGPTPDRLPVGRAGGEFGSGQFRLVGIDMNVVGIDAHDKVGAGRAGQVGGLDAHRQEQERQARVGLAHRVRQRRRLIGGLGSGQLGLHVLHEPRLP